ncbi:hypothetical protein [Mucilaginibacter sp. HD30]
MNLVVGLKIFFFAFITNVSFAQTLHSIRFVHIGEEDKPIGTLAISVEKKIIPRDRMTDHYLGKSVKTNMKTFETIRNFTEASKHLVSRKDNESDYRIIINNKKNLYLNYKSGRSFFEDLRAKLAKTNCDKAVIAAFKYK